MKGRVLLAGMMLLPWVAHAQRISRVSGAELLGSCAASQFSKVQNCEAYLDGVADIFSGFAKFGPKDAQGKPLAAIVCIPASVTGKDLRLAVLRGLKAQPALQARPAGEAVEHVFRQAYPCH